MKSSAEELFNNMSLLYRNIYNLLNAFQQASTSTNSTVEVNIEKIDGTFEVVKINSFQKLQQELTRIDSNFKSLLNGDNLSYILAGDGSLSQLTKTSFINAEYLENFSFNSNNECIIDKTSPINDLVFPNVKIPITVDSKLISDIYCRTFEITQGWENIPENPEIVNLEYLATTGSVIFNEVNRKLKLEKEQIKFFGKFNIESLKIDPISNNIFTIVLNEVKYTGINVIGNSIELKINDIFVSKSGSSKYIINEINKITKELKVTRIAGSEILTVGIDALYFNQILLTDTKIVGVPIKPSQKVIVFLSTENFKNISYPSKGIKIDTSTYIVIYDNKTYTLDDFFSSYVLDFSAYLMTFINEATIPVSLGVHPDKPVLDSSNFKVVQVNKHLGDSKSIAEITDLNKRKQAIQNEISFKQTQIDKNQLEIDTLTFANVSEKTLKVNQLLGYRQDITALKTNLLTISKDIDTNATKFGLKNIVPKYNLIAFWPIQNPIYSPLTKAQHIIKYDIQCRYLSSGVDTIENTSYSMVDDNGKLVSVVFSPWIDIPSKVLSKTKNILGDFAWQTEILDSVDEININQLSVAIQEGEAIEVRVRAVSEAGYPISPLKSEWSEILRVTFPDDLKQSNIVSVISQNNIDLNKAEFEGILQDHGLLSHVANTIIEAEKTYLHHAKDIASGQFTTEQKNIPLDTVIINLMKEISLLKGNSLNNNISVDLVDFNNEAFPVKNNTTMELFAGNYADNLSILDSTNWGSIIRKKGYIKIKNTNSIPVEIKTFVPGVIFDATKAPGYYNVIVKNVNQLQQSSKQIIYFRNTDLTNQQTEHFKLVSPKLTNSLTYPTTMDMDDLALETDRNIVYLDNSGTLQTCKLKQVYDPNFVAFTKDHPLFGTNALIPEFDRLKLYTDNVKALQYQSEFDGIGDNLMGFNDNDFYAVGNKTCGAFLYPVISNISNISVVGDTAIATMVITGNSEILIPFVFEYRMIDRIGNINGLLNQDKNIPLEYSKKIGIDMLLNSEIFKFDINIICKLKSKVTTADSKNVSSLIGKYIGQNVTFTTNNKGNANQLNNGTLQ